MVPFQDTRAISPVAGMAGEKVCTTEPSSRRIRLSSMLVALTAPSRNEKLTPPRWSRAKSERLVAVSSAGAPASAGPGTAVSFGLGVGAAGGITLTAVRLV